MGIKINLNLYVFNILIVINLQRPRDEKENTIYKTHMKRTA